MENVEADNGGPAAMNGTMITYMWVLTLQWPIGGGPRFASTTMYGTWNAPMGASRVQIYQTIVQDALKRIGRDSADTLFFCLEPDQLGG
ncbi:hypothetical protein [Nonomuraea basaltis]|uniref:hypothetical protein n=1 Tax=Nonomuraea basaltis TaxID=2495887 RepID=UPI00110C56F8|nr:hypothetical protein [Nonomuraea basaltis]TMR96605.1 hypothetical protein EJK15_22160 [Nonomuraea basaltis]